MSIENKYYFKGYPTGNYLKIFCKILEMWNIQGNFPINFIKVEGLKVNFLDYIYRIKHQKLLKI